MWLVKRDYEYYALGAGCLATIKAWQGLSRMTACDLGTRLLLTNSISANLLTRYRM